MQQSREFKLGREAGDRGGGSVDSESAGTRYGMPNSWEVVSESDRELLVVVNKQVYFILIVSVCHEPSFPTSRRTCVYGQNHFPPGR